MLKVILGDLMDEKSLAKFALKHLDYTLLDAEADEKQITEFLERASRWKPAAVCVLPSGVSRAKETLDPQIIVASAAGCFPNPNGDINQRIDDIKTAVEGGADEIDIVMDFEAMMDLRPSDARSTLEQLIDESYYIMKDLRRYPEHSTIGEKIEAPEVADYFYWEGQ